MNKIALITGASRGIGAATARHLSNNGYSVAINYKTRKNAADSLVDELLCAGGKAISIKADVSVEEDVIRMFEQVDRQLGSLTALVNNAAILQTQMPLVQMTAERINHILTTNVTSCFLCCKEALKRMSTNANGTGGAIVNVSSRASVLGAPNEYIDYAASKGAVDTLTIGLSKEVASQGVRVNCVRPGLIYTDMHTDGGEPDRVDRIGPILPMQRGGQPHEVATAIGWLLSDEASFVTGTFIDLAGGG